jgi:hypothetical protein
MLQVADLKGLRRRARTARPRDRTRGVQALLLQVGEFYIFAATP